MDFKDKVVVVTGGARGIGKTICDEFRKAGAQVCTIDLLDNDYFVGDIADEKTLINFKEKEMKFAHVTIKVKDLEESLKFYQEIVGLPLVSRFPAGPNMEIVFLGEGETLVELIHDSGQTDISIGSDISIGFAVDSLDETMEFLKGKGIDIHSGPFEPNPNTKFLFVLDPNGLRIQFIEQ